MMPFVISNLLEYELPIKDMRSKNEETRAVYFERGFAERIERGGEFENGFVRSVIDLNHLKGNFFVVDTGKNTVEKVI